MARIRLVRHGEAAAAWGGAGADSDPGLSELGRAQAEAVVHILAADPPARLLTSPLRRCRETAAPSAVRWGLEPALAPQVAEVPTPSDMPDADRGAWLTAAFVGSWSDIPGGDYGAWRDGVAEFLLGCGGAVVFTHFVAINAAVAAATGNPRVGVFRPGNASVTVLETDGVRLRLVELGAEAQGRVL